jgi:DNA invertase Pin-like site-specific DNA recombinase
MTKLKDVAYDIEQLYIDGFSPSRIAKILDIEASLVYDWLDEQKINTDEEVYSPYYGA